MALHIRHRRADTPVHRVLLSICCTVAIGVAAAWVLPTEAEPKRRACKIIQGERQAVATSPPASPRMQPVDLAPVTAPLMVDSLGLVPPLPSQDISSNIEIPNVCVIDDLEPFAMPELIPAPDALPTAEQQPQRSAPAIASGSNSHAEPVYTPPQYISTPQPEYPAELQRRRIAGEVRVRIHVDAAGKAQAVDVLASPHPKLSQSVQHTILHFWRFRAAVRGKHPVAATVVTSVLFEL